MFCSMNCKWSNKHGLVESSLWPVAIFATFLNISEFEFIGYSEKDFTLYWYVFWYFSVRHTVSASIFLVFFVVVVVFHFYFDLQLLEKLKQKIQVFVPPYFVLIVSYYFFHTCTNYNINSTWNVFFIIMFQYWFFRTNKSLKFWF